MLDSFKRWTKTEHELCQEDLSAYTDGQLEPPQRARVEKHLQTCAACRADLEALRHTVALLHMVPAVKPPRSFLLPASEVAQQRGVQRQRFAYAALRLATAVATVLLVLVVSGDALLRFALPVPVMPPSGLHAEPTMAALEQPAAGDEGNVARLAAPQPGAQEPTVEGQPEAGAAAAPAPGATVEAVVEPMGVGEAGPEQTPLPPGTELTAVTKTRPSRTSAVSAAPPPAPTEEPAQAPPAPTPETPLPTATPVPPTVTPVPPTPVPEPTYTLAPPTLTPARPEAVVGPPVQPAARPPWQGMVEPIRSVLSRLELPLAIVTLLLMAITLWMRRRQRAT